VKLGLITDGLRLKAWMRLNAAGLDHLFNAVVTYEDTGKRKPAKEPFLLACEELEVKPQECLMIGDWPERDIEGAKKIGMKTCWAKYGSPVKECKSDFELNSIKQILEVVA